MQPKFYFTDEEIDSIEESVDRTTSSYHLVGKEHISYF